ncbi:MAG: ATP-binding protein, partial [Armatimonadota bacterium]
YSPAAERLFGWTAEEALGLPAPPYVGERFEADSLALRTRIAAGETIKSYETQRQRRDGSLVEVSISLAPLLGGDNDEGRYVGMIMDISERLRAETEAEERGALEELLQVTERMLAETSPAGLLEQLAAGVRQLTEAAACTTAYGYHGGKFAAEALTYSEKLDPSVAGVALRELRAEVHLKLADTNSPVRLTDAEMAVFPSFSLLAAHSLVHGFIGVPLTDASRETMGMIMASNKADGSDLSARDEALLFQLTALASLALRHLDLNLALARQAAELEAANLELASFSHSVSHDLRAPLRAVDGFSQALLEDYGGKLDAKALDYLGRLRAATQRMGDLIDDLLQLSRVTRETMRWEQVDLSALATEIAAELSASDPSRAVEWQIEPGIVANGHPRLLGVLLRNLLGNAFKFTGQTPEAVIEFGAEQGEERPVYFVKDNGAGFDMTYADKLFAPFQRLHALEDFPGNGVGLATVQRVINRHGGKVWAEAQVNQGATFRFTY